jgi:ParB family transcriptional regulator, chromosome partitioning protein
MSGKAEMADEAARSRLGRGLAALIGDVGNESSAEQRPPGQRRVPTAALRPNVRNPRRVFSDNELSELAASIRERGIIQPIVVRPVRGAADAFEIIAGERRWRAAQRATLHEVPVVVIEATDEESLQLAIIENVQRADLNPLEEAEGYRSLIRDFSYSQDDVARMVGKSRSHVANMLRLQTLPDRVKEHLNAGRLSAGHARALVGHHDAERLADELVAGEFNVRQAEEYVRLESGRPAKRAKAPKKSAEQNADTLALQRQLSDALGLVVSIDHRGEGGVVSIRYRNLDQLDDLTRRLSK